MKNNLIKILLFSILIYSCNERDNNTEKKPTNEVWSLIYKTDKNGKTIFGSKDELISCVRKGYPIRIGWASRRRSDSTKSVEHVVDGEFLTIANGKEVFAQITPFLAQRPDLTGDTLSMTLMPSTSHWILSTNGLISSANLNHSTDTINTYPPSTFRYPLSWFSKTSGSLKNESPLW